MTLLWHYTHGEAFMEILSLGYIDVARIGTEPDERSVAWFSSDQFWERTVRKALPSAPKQPFGMEGMLRNGMNLFRIGVAKDTVPLNWTAIRRQSGMSSKTANAIVRVARDWGANPYDWYGSFEPVRKDMWITMELFYQGRWNPCKPKPIKSEDGQEGFVMEPL
jgi:hypothetical protein